MRRNKQEVDYWLKRMGRLFKEYPSTKLVKNRYLTIKVMLQERYPEIKDNPKIEKMLKDAIWIDRKIRWATEGQEETLKQELSDKFIDEELNG
jgi:hypothetical protein